MQVAAEYARLRKEDRSVQPVKERLVKLWERDRDPYFQAFHGPEFTLDQLLGIPAVPGEGRGDLAEPGRFGTLARRVWHPLLNCEELS
jgi:exodeoxyribonuclease V gamma subunit